MVFIFLGLVVWIVSLVLKANQVEEGRVKQHNSYVERYSTKSKEEVFISPSKLKSLLHFFESLPEHVKQNFRDDLSPGENYGLGVLLGGYRLGDIQVRHLSGETLPALDKLQKWAVDRSLEAHLLLFNNLAEGEQIEVLIQLSQWAGVFSSLNNCFLDNNTLEGAERVWTKDFCHVLHNRLMPYYQGFLSGAEPMSLSREALDAIQRRGYTLGDILPMMANQIEFPAKLKPFQQIVLKEPRGEDITALG